MSDLSVKIAMMENQIDDLDQLLTELTSEQEDVRKAKGVIARNWEGDDFEIADSKFSEIIKILSDACKDLTSQRNFLENKKQAFDDNRINL